jgi:hypothetical protein
MNQREAVAVGYAMVLAPVTVVLCVMFTPGMWFYDSLIGLGLLAFVSAEVAPGALSELLWQIFGPRGHTDEDAEY